MVIVVLLLAFSGKATNTTSNWTYTVSTWTGDWEFAGFAIGPDSGDYYHLLSTPIEQQCAVIRQTNEGTISWAKMYPEDQCSGIVIRSNESHVYFANKEASYIGINSVDCSDGRSFYSTTSFLNVSGGIKNFDIVSTQRHFAISGNMTDSAGSD